MVYRKMTEQQRRMMEDDEFFEVTNHDVEHLLRRMSGCYPRADIIKMRKKYDLWIDDLEKKFMTKLALDYDHHIITRGHREPDSCHLPTDSSTFYVNGYTEKEWLMLTDEKFLPSQRELTRFMNHCKKTSDSGALEILQLKYGHIYEEWKRKTLEKNGLDKDTPCQSLSGWNIDGVTFLRWKLLHDPHFTPKTMTALVSTIRRLRAKGCGEDAETIERKYEELLYPEMKNATMQQEIQAANDFFNSLHSDK